VYGYQASSSVGTLRVANTLAIMGSVD